jgi:hypothetical protein
MARLLTMRPNLVKPGLVTRALSIVMSLQKVICCKNALYKAASSGFFFSPYYSCPIQLEESGLGEDCKGEISYSHSTSSVPLLNFYCI